MTQTQPSAFACPPRPQQGMAIGLILTLVALAALLSVVITLGGQAGAMTSASGHAAADAAIITQQAATLKTASQISVLKNSADLTRLTLDTTFVDHTRPGVGIYQPLDGGTDPQVPPADAFSGSPGSWTTISLNVTGVGTGGASLMLALDGLSQGVCTQIDKLVTGVRTIPAVTVAVSSGASYDFRSQSSLNGDYEICYQDSNGVYHYYRTERAN